LEVIANILRKEKLVFLISIIFFAIFPIIPEKIKSFPVIFLLVTKFIFVLFDKQWQFKHKLFLILSSFFILNFLSIFYSLSFEFPLKRIETSMSLILIPLGFAVFKPQDFFLLKKYRKYFIDIFIISSCVLSLILLLYFYNLGLFSHETLKVNAFRKATQEIPMFNGHPIYISIYFALGILFLIDKLKKLILRNILLYLFGILILGCSLVLLSSKGVIISLLISVIFYLYFRIKNIEQKYLLISTILVTSIYGIFLSPTLERRFREFTKKTTFTEFRINNSTSIRIAIYNCAIKTIAKAPILGYGWGEGKTNLLKCYKNKQKYLYKKRYNSHNQYFSSVINGGIINLLFFLFFLGYIFKKAKSTKDYIFSVIIIFYFALFFSENILERQTGLILFIYICCLFTFSNIKYKETNRLK
jgi:O-antigen ligase